MYRPSCLADVVDVFRAELTIAEPTANAVDDVGSAAVVPSSGQDESVPLKFSRQDRRAWRCQIESNRHEPSLEEMTRLLSDPSKAVEWPFENNCNINV